MSDIEQVITITKKIETTLRNQYNAEGRGLHELVTSIEKQLDSELVKNLRRIATIRNNVVHDDGYDFNQDRDRFFESAGMVLARLGQFDTIVGNSPSPPVKDGKQPKLAVYDANTTPGAKKKFEIAFRWKFLFFFGLAYLAVATIFPYFSQLRTQPAASINSEKLIDPDKKLRLGSVGNEVKFLQTFLKQEKLYQGDVDGKFDLETQQALMQYQRSQGILADGIVGSSTWKAIELESK